MKVTLEEIARNAGVSKATVSRVLNDNPNGVGAETRKRVKQVMEKMGYANTMAEDCKFVRSKSIVLMIPDVTNPYFASIVKSVETRAMQDDYMVILSNTDFMPEKEAEYITKLVAKRVDGIILISSGTHCSKEHFRPQKYGIPMVMLDRKLADLENYPSVCANNMFASYSACEMLIKKGAKRVVFISGNENISTSVERYEGYRNALEKYGLPFESRYVKYGQYTVEGGYNAIMELEKEDVKYDAVMAANDLMALGAMKAIKELSYRVPDDVQIIGCDNVTFSQFCNPPLSTIQQPTTEMGRRATEMLLRMINGEKVNENVRIQPKLILRETTK
ncbi:MAG: LacI family DNA-binding transcriptional regulator [Eubacteriales bacterium]|nr:LacI family DNA-binding transcriptional regulator [Eubacteriales bacterium]